MPKRSVTSPGFDDPWFVGLRQATLRHLVDHYDEIEFDLAAAAVAEFKAFVKGQGLAAWVGGRRNEVNGQLRASVFESPSRTPQAEHFLELPPLGRLKSVVVESDFMKVSTLRRYSQTLKEIVERKYDAVVMALEIHAKETSQHSLDSCRTLVITATEKKHIKFHDDCWLIASDSDEGTLLLSEEIVHKALSFFRDHPNQNMSPLEMLVSLVRARFPHKQTLSSVAHDKSLPQLVGDFESSQYKQSAMDLWLAIGTLHEFQDFSVIPLAASGSRRLTLGCKARVAKAAFESLAPFRTAIQSEFRRGANHFGPLVLPTTESALAARSMMAVVAGKARAPTEDPSKYGVFFSYSRTDRDIVGMLRDGLAPAIDGGLIDFLFDEIIDKGRPWEDRLREMIARAHAGVFLVSRASLASKIIMRMELPIMLESVERSGSQLRWLPLQECLWSETAFNKLQASWPPSTPLRSMNLADHDKAIQSFCKDIVKLAKENRA